MTDLDRHLERCELLTPIGTPAALALMRAGGVHYGGEVHHRGEVLEDGTDVLVTDVVLPIKVTTEPRARPVRAELAPGVTVVESENPLWRALAAAKRAKGRDDE